MQVLRIYLIYQITIRMRIIQRVMLQKNGGGGVINTSSHEIDLIAYFLDYQQIFTHLILDHRI